MADPSWNGYTCPDPRFSVFFFGKVRTANPADPACAASSIHNTRRDRRALDQIVIDTGGANASALDREALLALARRALRRARDDDDDDYEYATANATDAAESNPPPPLRGLRGGQHRRHDAHRAVGRHVPAAVLRRRAVVGVHRAADRRLLGRRARHALLPAPHDVLGEQERGRGAVVRQPVRHRLRERMRDAVFADGARRAVPARAARVQRLARRRGPVVPLLGPRPARGLLPVRHEAQRRPLFGAAPVAVVRRRRRRRVVRRRHDDDDDRGEQRRAPAAAAAAAST